MKMGYDTYKITFVKNFVENPVEESLVVTEKHLVTQIQILVDCGYKIIKVTMKHNNE